MLQRTQLMIDSETKEDLLFLSRETNRSMSEMVREFVAEKVKKEKKKIRYQKTKRMNAVEALLQLAKDAEEIEKKYGSSGPTDGSYNLDHYLYGAPKKKPSKRFT